MKLDKTWINARLNMFDIKKIIGSKNNQWNNSILLM